MLCRYLLKAAFITYAASIYITNACELSPLVWQTNLIVVFIMFGFFLAKNKTYIL